MPPHIHTSLHTSLPHMHTSLHTFLPCHHTSLHTSLVMSLITFKQ
jgi:hypothetical protein